MGRNHTGPPYSISCVSSHAPNPVATDHTPGDRSTCLPAVLQTTTDDRCSQAKQYWPYDAPKVQSC